MKRAHITMIIIGGLVLIVTLAAVLIYLLKSADVVQRQDGQRTPAIEPSPHIVSFHPDSGSSNVSVYQFIIVTFDMNIEDQDVMLDGLPDVSVAVDKKDNKLIVKPTPRWTYGKTYQFELLGQTYRFTTIGEVTLDPADEMEYSDLKSLSPAQFLAEQTPYANELFSVVSNYNPEENGFVFLVETPFGVPLEDGRQAFSAWANDLGISQSQFDKLTIQYFESQR